MANNIPYNANASVTLATNQFTDNSHAAKVVLCGTDGTTTPGLTISAGTLTISGTHPVTVTSGTTTLSAGTLTSIPAISGTVALSAGTLTSLPAVSIASGTLTTGTVTVGSMPNVTLNGTASSALPVTLASTVLTAGTLTSLPAVSGTVALSAGTLTSLPAVAISAGTLTTGTVTVASQPAVTGTITIGAGTLTNILAQSGTLSIASGTITQGTGGVSPWTVQTELNPSNAGTAASLNFFNSVLILAASTPAQTVVSTIASRRIRVLSCVASAVVAGRVNFHDGATTSALANVQIAANGNAGFQYSPGWFQTAVGGTLTASCLVANTVTLTGAYIAL